MLRRVGETVDSKDAVVKIKDASFPTQTVPLSLNRYAFYHIIGQKK